ncbi:thioredoxin domain-containing protein [Maribacter sp.]|nr:thioredoxin domain-containing protein [Maribacter sp.]
MEFYEIAYTFLKSASIGISKNYLQERLEAHTDYPSLNSLTDFLDELDIENSALQVEEKHRWRELGFPFLAHEISKKGTLDFQVIESEKQVKSEEDFLSTWSGITLILGDQRQIKHEEHNEQHHKERSEKKVLFAISVFLILLATMHQLASFSLVFFIHFVLTLVGLVISCNIVAYSLGIKTEISDKFCKLESSGCNTVLKSKLGKFTGDVGLGEVAAIFFGGMFIYLSFRNDFTSNATLQILAVIQLLVFLFTFVSIGYQLYLRSWCKLCLFLTLVIWLQTLSLFYSFSILDQTIFDTGLLLKQSLSLALGFAIASTWLIVKPLFLNGKKSLYQQIKIRKWRQDPYWFHALLPLHRRVEDSIWNREIFYGNPEGVLQFVIISTPFCKYCSKAHQELEQIVDNHSNDIGVRIRFTLSSPDTETEEYKALYQILNTYEQLVWKMKLENTHSLMRGIVKDWFNIKNQSEFRALYPVQIDGGSEDINTLINQSTAWANAMKINQTPSFFINGYEMPNPHTFKDLFLFVSDYIEILKTQKHTPFVQN